MLLAGKAQRSVREKGKQARHAGEARSENPYWARSFRDAWFAGWDEASACPTRQCPTCHGKGTVRK